MAAYTGTPALPALLAGDIPSAGTDWAAILAALHAITDPWPSYTPVWTATTTNPVVNNGTSIGKYWQSGKTVMYVGVITMGSTTTYGSGSYLLSVPVPAVSGTAVGFIFFKSNATPTNNRAGVIVGAAGGGNLVPFTNSAATNVNPTSPFTWAANDNMYWSILYEAA